jgi:NAD(P)-dependent dehydrogenase (short-subunit alcohol dehydrogenase family)
MESKQAAPGRRWLVTGAAGGIGRAIATRVVAGGEPVCIIARGESGQAAAREIGGGAVAVMADVADPDAVKRAVSEAAELLGGIDVVVNNAGQHRGGRVDALSLQDWNSTIATNLGGPLHVIRAALPHLEPGSAIVNIGAVVGYRGFPGDSCYGASKAGLAGLSQVLAAELAPRGIRVNLVVPGFVMSEMTRAISERARQEIIAKIPMRRIGEAEEIAEVVWWVAGSSYMTGSVVATDGGLMGSL